MKIKIVLFICLFGYCSNILKAQLQSVFAVSGSSDQIHEIQLDWTVGEIATSHFAFPNSMITEGFHQPILEKEQIQLDVASEQTTIHLFPNPLEAELNIYWEKINSNQRLEWILYDVYGNVIMSQIQRINSAQYTMPSIPSGIYLLHFKLLQEEAFQIKKLIKI